MTIAQNLRPAALRAAVLSVSLLGLAGVGAFTVSGAAHAADPAVVNEKFADLQPAIDDLRADVGKDRRDIVKANMLLLPSEATTFWPLYDQYRAERKAQGDEMVSLITDYVAQTNTMSEEDATKLTKRYFDIQDKTIEVKKKWFKKFSKELSARTTARFFQIDNKLDAVVNVALAAKIPLIH